MRSLRNIFGEGGQPLTVLSLLPRAAVPERAPFEVAAGDLEGELCRIAGGDGPARSVVTIDADGQVATHPQQTFAEVARRVLGLAGGDVGAPVELRVLQAEGWTGEDGPDDAEVRSAVATLFAPDPEGTPVTVFSVVLRHPPADT
jgi:hypothetical protein